MLLFLFSYFSFGDSDNAHFNSVSFRLPIFREYSLYFTFPSVKKNKAASYRRTPVKHSLRSSGQQYAIT